MGLGTSLRVRWFELGCLSEGWSGLAQESTEILTVLGRVRVREHGVRGIGFVWSVEILRSSHRDHVIETSAAFGNEDVVPAIFAIDMRTLGGLDSQLVSHSQDSSCVGAHTDPPVPSHIVFHGPNLPVSRFASASIIPGLGEDQLSFFPLPYIKSPTRLAMRARPRYTPCHCRPRTARCRSPGSRNVRPWSRTRGCMDSST